MITKWVINKYTLLDNDLKHIDISTALFHTLLPTKIVGKKGLTLLTI